MELEELDEILDEGNQPRLSEEDEDEDVVVAQAEKEEEKEEEGTRKVPLYSQVGKYIVEQAQRPTVVVGAVAGVSLGDLASRASLTRFKTNH